MKAKQISTIIKTTGMATAMVSALWLGGMDANAANDTVAAECATQWVTAETNAYNYSDYVLNTEYEKVWSVLPVNNNYSKVHVVIGGEQLANVEKAFGKTASENQIVVHVSRNYTEISGMNSLNKAAREQGREVSRIFNIKAEERTKADYKLVREIETTEESVVYTVRLTDPVAKTRGASVVQILADGTIETFEDIDTDSNTFSFETKNASGVFAILVK